MNRRLASVSLVSCLLFSTLTVVPVGAATAAGPGAQFHAAQENATAPNVEFIDCDTVRITGDAAYTEVDTSYLTKRGEIDTEVQSIELTGNETVLSEDDLYPNGVGSYQGEFVIDGVGLFESSTGSMVESFSNPNSQSCFDALPRPSDTTASPEGGTTTAADSDTSTQQTSTPSTTETTTSAPTTTSPETTESVSASPDTETTTSQPDSETAASPGNGASTAPSQDADSESSAGSGNDGTSGAGSSTSNPSSSTSSGAASTSSEVASSDRPPVSFTANASSGTNETLVTYNVTGEFVNASENATLTVNASERTPNSTRAPTVDNDSFEALSYLTVNSTANETAVENLSVEATVNRSRLAALDANESQVQFHAWNPVNDTWIPLNTSIGNATNASQVFETANATNTSHVFGSTSNSSVYAIGINRSDAVATATTAPENGTADEAVAVEETGTTAEESTSPAETDSATNSPSAQQSGTTGSLAGLDVAVLAAPLVLVGGALVAFYRT